MLVGPITIGYLVACLSWFAKPLQNQIGVYVDGLPKEEQCDPRDEHWMIQPGLIVLLEVCQPSSLHIAVYGAEYKGKEDDVEWRWFAFHVQWINQHPTKETKFLYLAKPPFITNYGKYVPDARFT